MCLLVDFALRRFETAAWTLAKSMAVPWVHHLFHRAFNGLLAHNECNSSYRVAIPVP